MSAQDMCMVGSASREHANNSAYEDGAAVADPVVSLGVDRNAVIR